MKKWSYHETVIQESKDLSSVDKEQILTGLHQIRRILGKSFLEIIVQQRNPILSYFRNTAPWTRFWLKEFGEMLSTLETSLRFERIKQKLISKEDFSSAISELEIAYRFAIAGFSVEFYPKHGRYECDLLVQKSDKKVYVEVSNIGPSQEERKSSYTLNELTKSFMFDPEIQVDGKIYKWLSNPRIAEIRNEIKIKVQKAKKEDKCFEISHPGIVDIIICPRSLSARAHNLLKQKRTGSHFEGPSYDIDEMRRVGRTIRDENKQLPKNEPGLIVLFNDNIAVEGDAESYQELADEIEEEIYERSNLIGGVLIFPHFVGSDEGSGYEEDFAWSRRTRYRLGGENTLIIKNRYSKDKIDEKIIQALIASNP